MFEFANVSEETSGREVEQVVLAGSLDSRKVAAGAIACNHKSM